MTQLFRVDYEVTVNDIRHTTVQAESMEEAMRGIRSDVDQEPYPLMKGNGHRDTRILHIEPR